MEGHTKGHLVIIGGAEDKHGDSVILKSMVKMLGPSSKLTVLTTATESPEIVGSEYKKVFSRLGLQEVDVLNVNTREDANSKEMSRKIRESKGIFFTGGDQLRITSILGGTQVYEDLKQIYYTGGMIVGTSAGASVMSNTMIVEGESNEPARKCTLKMAPGLGFFTDTIIDQHFDQRGRLGRLLCGVAENPHMLGIGIDEDTAIIVYPDYHFEVIGNNAVTLVDGRYIKDSNVSELQPDEILAITGITLHVLPAGYGYDTEKREAIRLH